MPAVSCLGSLFFRRRLLSLWSCFPTSAPALVLQRGPSSASTHCSAPSFASNFPPFDATDFFATWLLKKNSLVGCQCLKFFLLVMTGGACLLAIKTLLPRAFA